MSPEYISSLWIIGTAIVSLILIKYLQRPDGCDNKTIVAFSLLAWPGIAVLIFLEVFQHLLFGRKNIGKKKEKTKG